jgi:hypothetical protein
MHSSEFETEEVRPMAARCDADGVSVKLADGREVQAPLWWYPFPLRAEPTARAEIELQFDGLWWPTLDEGISIKSMLLGWRAPGAVPPSVAAE